MAPAVFTILASPCLMFKAAGRRWVRRESMHVRITHREEGGGEATVNFSYSLEATNRLLWARMASRRLVDPSKPL